jgi:AbrB family looped-hinge helix DNA binding protein
MAKSKLTRKGQVTIPQEVRRRLGLRPGDEIEFIEDQESFRVQKRIPLSPFRHYRGYLKDLAGRDPDDLVEQMRGR